MQPLTSAEILLKVRDDLAKAPFISNAVTQLRIAQDPGDLLDQLLDQPASFRLVIHWSGDKNQSEQPLSAIVDHTVEIWVVKAKIPLLTPGNLLVASQGDQPPLLALIDSVVAWVRSNALPDGITSRYWRYEGASQLNPLDAPNLQTTAFKLTFAITAVKPHIPMRNLEG
jgi:hypothetical protein